MLTLKSMNAIQIRSWDTFDIVRTLNVGAGVTGITSDLSLIFLYTENEIMKYSIETGELLGSVDIELWDIPRLSPNEQIIYAVELVDGGEFLTVVNTHDLSKEYVSDSLKEVFVSDMSPDSSTIYYTFSLNGEYRLASVNIIDGSIHEYSEFEDVRLSRIGDVTAWEYKNGVWVIQNNDGVFPLTIGFWDLKFLSDGSAVVGIIDSELIVVSTTTGNEIQSIRLPHNPRNTMSITRPEHFIVSPTSNTVIVSSNGIVTIVDLETQNLSYLDNKTTREVTTSFPMTANILL
jgi:hypothetical protein